MTDNGESREKATGIKMDFLSTKLKTRIGFWNVRTMFEAGGLAQITAGMKKYKLLILGVSESKWTGTEKIKTSTDEKIPYFGRENAQNQEGLERKKLKWKPVSSRH